MVGETATVPSAHGHQTPRSVEELRAAREHGRILDRNLEILRTLSPEFRRRRSLARSLEPASAAAPAAGDTLTFRIPKTSVPAGQSCSSFDVVRARAVYVGTRAVVFEDVASPLAGTMDAAYASIGQEYDGTMRDLLREKQPGGQPVHSEGGPGRMTAVPISVCPNPPYPVLCIAAAIPLMLRNSACRSGSRSASSARAR